MGYFELGKSVGGSGCFRVIRNARFKKDIKAFVKNNPNENLYMTVYTFAELSKGKPIYDSAICDRMFIEIDSESHGLIDDRAFRELRKLIDWCREEEFEGGEIRPQVFFSGRSGYHIVFTFERPLQDLKDDRVLKLLIKRLSEKSDSAIDLAANNGHSQMRRIPNTKNHKSGYYCIPLTLEEAYNYPPDKILELAKKPRNSVNNFDGPSPYFTEVVRHTKSYLHQTIKTQLHRQRQRQAAHTNYEYVKDMRGRKKVRPCIEKMIRQTNPTFQERTYIAAELMRCGYSDLEIHKIFRNFNKYQHHITAKHLDKLREKNLFAPSCDTLQMRGQCSPEMHNFEAERNDLEKKEDNDII